MLFKKPKLIEIERRIRANDNDYNSQFNYADNYIKTSKYNVLTFLPVNLFEQFRRLANFYFLCLLILQMIPPISSLTPLTTAVPLIVVLAVTAIKDAVDDLQRHRSDRQVNNRLSKVLRNGALVDERWHKVQVGDIIQINNDNFVAADLLLLSTSEPNGLCYVETAELDGETNLKCRQVLPETAVLLDDIRKLSTFHGEIRCEPPNNNLTKYEGTLIWNNKKYSLDNDKMLLRGCVLRNTKWAFGVVIFAGRDTKLMQNSGKTIFKRTSLDRLLNLLILGIVLVLFSMCLFCTIACGIWESITGSNFQIYLPWDSSAVKNPDDRIGGAAIISILIFFSYAIVLNTVVPISLYVSVEIIRFFHSLLINWDEKMYYEPTDTPAKARTTTLNEELGQIEYIFTDKTGTLTQNLMKFNKCSIDGQLYGDIIDPYTGEVVDPAQVDAEHFEPVDFSSNIFYEDTFEFYDPKLLQAVNNKDEKVMEFFRLLALCHTVMCEERENGKIVYQAQSPDEAALTSAARNFGFVFRSRTPMSITIQVLGEIEVYELLAILDFNNVRKRMSVIIRKEGKVILYCKGADSMIFERLDPSMKSLKNHTNGHLNKFACEGLRTLCLAKKEIGEEEYEVFRNKLHEASTALDNREDKVNACYEEIEKNLILIGATAIEDKLQDGVPSTIANLSAAGIKVWVLTGDKQETAINIGYSCQLLTDEFNEIFTIEGWEYEQVEQELRTCKETMKKWELKDLKEKRNRMKSGTNLSVISYSNTYQSSHNTGSKVGPINKDLDYNNDGNNNYLMNNGLTVSNQQLNINNQLNKNSLIDNNIQTDQPTSGFAIVINGHSLVHALQPNMELLFLEVASNCNAVICCRVTPLQKALVVDLVKRNKNAVTLAIGDGANDVSMIKMAHIGVGISGQEGMQAVLAADFSLAQFRFLERLLLVHGRYSYFRMCKFLRYFFYKNFAFTLCHFWYAFFCGFSAQTLYDPAFISFYNVFYTSLPVLALGIFDQDVDDRMSLRYPLLYTPGTINLLFNKKEFLKSVIHGVLTSFVLFFIAYGAFNNAVSPEGTNLDGHQLFGTVVSTNLVIVCTAQIALDTSYWTVFNHVVIWGSVAFYFAMTLFINSSFIGNQYLGCLRMALSSAQFWFTLILTLGILLIPVIAIRFYTFNLYPTLSDKVRLKQRLTRFKSAIKSQFPPHMYSGRRKSSVRRSRRSVRSGYAFAHQEGFGTLIMSGKLAQKPSSTRYSSFIQPVAGSFGNSLSSNAGVYGNTNLNLPKTGAIPITGIAAMGNLAIASAGGLPLVDRDNLLMEQPVKTSRSTKPKLTVANSISSETAISLDSKSSRQSSKKNLAKLKNTQQHQSSLSNQSVQSIQSAQITHSNGSNKHQSKKSASKQSTIDQDLRSNHSNESKHQLSSEELNKSISSNNREEAINNNENNSDESINKPSTLSRQLTNQSDHSDSIHSDSAVMNRNNSKSELKNDHHSNKSSSNHSKKKPISKSIENLSGKNKAMTAEQRRNRLQNQLSQPTSAPKLNRSPNKGVSSIEI